MSQAPISNTSGQGPHKPQSVPPKTFEEAMERMEAIIRHLDSDATPLQQSLDLYKQGQDLFLYCRKELDEARLSIEKLSEDLTTTQAASSRSQATDATTPSPKPMTLAP